MLLMQQHQEGLKRRLFAIGLPKYTIPAFIGEMVKWEKHSGVEWTIKRLKGLKVDLIRQKAGLPILSWVRKNRSGKIYGVIGSLFRWSEKSDQNFRRVVQAFMAYTFYIHGSVTPAQRKKFLEAIGADPVDLEPSFMEDFGKTVKRVLRRRPLLLKASPLVAYRGSNSKKAPRLFGKRSVPQSSHILDDLQLFETKGGLHLYGKYRRIYTPLLKGLESELNERLMVSHFSGGFKFEVGRHEPLVGGEIHLLQEPGGKLRSVASPLRIHQEALRPLGTMLYRMVEGLPWDATFDQSKAIPFIQSHLGKGGKVHSVDLSSATDQFPLSLQEKVLRTILPVKDWDYVDLFVEISRSNWSSKELGQLKWRKGQPLGLYPSFALFTLTHGLLLRHLAGAYRHQFFVLGDDVVILEDKLYDKYISMLDRMKCPWSVDKSLSSDKVAEFAGKIVTEKWVIPQLKWREMSNDNFLDLCRLLGSRSRCLLNSKQRFVFDHVANLYPPVGLGFSLPGDNLVKMIERTSRFMPSEDAVLGSLMSLRRVIHSNCYATPEVIPDTDKVKEILATFDENVKSVLSETIFTRWESVSHMIEGLETVPAAREALAKRLPGRTHLPSRVSVLERYLKLIKRDQP